MTNVQLYRVMMDYFIATNVIAIVLFSMTCFIVWINRK